MDKTYNRTLVGKYSPSNKCFVPDGVEVYVRPKKTLPKRDCKHYFISVDDDSVKAPYAWVAEKEAPFNLQDFLTRNHLGAATDDELSHLKIMLDSIQKLDNGTPVAPAYVIRGLFEKQAVFTVHRIILY